MSNEQALRVKLDQVVSAQKIASNAVEELLSAFSWHLERKQDLPEAPTQAALPQLTMSGRGVAMLRVSEGSRLKPYLDQAGIWTIGVGHVIRDGEEHLHQGITPEQEVELLLRDVEWAEEAVRGLGLPRPLEQHQFDALVSFCFNVGGRAFRGSTMVRKLREGDYDCVPTELMRWVYYTSSDGQKRVSDGLVDRRRREGHLWVTGDYTGMGIE